MTQARTSSVNQPWAISDKYAERYGHIWTTLDFELKKITEKSFGTDPMNTEVGELKLSNSSIQMTYKDIIATLNRYKQIEETIFLEKPSKEELFSCSVKGQSFELRKHEIGRLVETLETAQDIILKGYRLGLYL